MLLELRVENLVLIERAELSLTPGLNVITGETGAGKTVLTSALDLLLGGKPKASLVRPGAKEAYVEGVFELSPELRTNLGERIPADCEELVIARRISAEGRTRAYVAGRTATVSELRQLAEELLSFYGQHEHRKLTVGGAQLDILDEFCGPQQLELRERCRVLYERTRELERSLEELAAVDAEKARESDLLVHELEQIDSVAPSETEETALLQERERLQHLEGLRSGSFAAAAAIEPGDDAVGAGALLAEGVKQLETIEGIDGHLDPLIERFRGLQLEAVDLAAELSSYGNAIEGSPGRLEEVEARLQSFEELKRKHGGSIASVLQHGEYCRERIATFTDAQGQIAEQTEQLEKARTEAAELAGQLSKARAQMAQKLADAVDRYLADLAMEAAHFSVDIAPKESVGPTGSDQVEFMLQANPGVAAAPLRETASGGELSRTMLALLSVAHASGQTTLVFDEIDSGIGGHTANAVGEALKRLAKSRQVLLITHLPQVAALADGHFTISKDLTQEPAVTEVAQLSEEEEVIAELVRMLGASGDDTAARDHALDLRGARIAA